MTFTNPRHEYQGRMEDYPLENYPDYEPGKPPRTERLESLSYLDEYERIWGQAWGAQGIGRLREVALVRPIEHEVDPLWERDPNFFLLRRARIDLGRLTEAILAYAELLESLDVKVRWMPIEETWGPYGPMRKFFTAGALMVVRGGAILPRFGQASWVRARNVNFQRFLASINCPILYQVHGTGICEVGTFVQLAEDAVMVYLSSASNQEGLDQVAPVLRRSGYEHVPVCHLTTIYDDFEPGGEFHLDMVIGVPDRGLALIYPGYFDYQAYLWLKQHRFRIIEVPRDEHHQWYPANLVNIESGLAIVPAGAKETIRRLRQAKVEVIPFDSIGLTCGTNGIRCVTMQLLRDPGPSLEEFGG